MVVKSSDSPLGLLWYYPSGKGKCFLLWIGQKSWLSHMVSTDFACWNESLGSLLSLWHHTGGRVRDSLQPGKGRNGVFTWPLQAWLKVGTVSSMVLGWSRRDYSRTVLVLLGSPFPGPLARESKLRESFFVCACWCVQVVSFFSSSWYIRGGAGGGRETKPPNLRELIISCSLGAKVPKTTQSSSLYLSESYYVFCTYHFHSF